MPRSMQVEPAVALDRAMTMFWAKGYAKTSLDRLVRKTGASRYGLYATFGGKDELLTEVLEAYFRKVTAKLFAPLDNPAASLPELRAMFDRVVTHHRRVGAQGCLHCNTAVELGQSGSAPARRVADYFKRLRDLMERALRNARERSELPRDGDISRLADYLLGVVAGSFLLARAHMNPRMIENFLATALEALDRQAPGPSEDKP